MGQKLIINKINNKRVRIKENPLGMNNKVYEISFKNLIDREKDGKYNYKREYRHENPYEKYNDK